MILLTGCVQQQVTSTCTDIQVDVDQVSREYDFSPFLEDGMKMIKLETNDSCLVSKIGQFAYVDDILYVADELEQTVFLFDSRGKFLKRVGKKGHGPGEYGRLGKFQVKGNQIYILDDMVGSRICVYDIPSGRGTYLHPNGKNHFDDFHIMEDDLYLVCNNRKSGQGYYNLLKVNMKNGETVTSRCGDSSGRRKGSLSGLPIMNVPPGTATMSIDAEVPGTVSVKLRNSVTVAASA